MERPCERRLASMEFCCCDWAKVITMLGQVKERRRMVFWGREEGAIISQCDERNSEDSLALAEWSTYDV
jgi:hypothetical protein